MSDVLLETLDLAHTFALQTPADWGHTYAWWRLLDGHRYQDEAGVVPATDEGQSVRYVTDLSGQGRHATHIAAQGEASGPPVIDADGYVDFGNAYLRYDPGEINPQPATIICANAKRRNVGGVEYVFSGGPNGSFERGVFYTTSTGEWTVRGGTSPAGFDSSGAAAFVDVWGTITGAWFADLDVQLRLDSVVLASGTFTTQEPFRAITLGNFEDIADTRDWPGPIAEVVVLSASDITLAGILGVELYMLRQKALLT